MSKKKIFTGFLLATVIASVFLAGCGTTETVTNTTTVYQPTTVKTTITPAASTVTKTVTSTVVSTPATTTTPTTTTPTTTPTTTTPTTSPATPTVSSPDWEMSEVTLTEGKYSAGFSGTITNISSETHSAEVYLWLYNEWEECLEVIHCTVSNVAPGATKAFDVQYARDTALIGVVVRWDGVVVTID